MDALQSKVEDLELNISLLSTDNANDIRADLRKSLSALATEFNLLSESHTLEFNEVFDRMEAEQKEADILRNQLAEKVTQIGHLNKSLTATNEGNEQSKSELLKQIDDLTKSNALLAEQKAKLTTDLKVSNNRLKVAEAKALEKANTNSTAQPVNKTKKQQKAEAKEKQEINTMKQQFSALQLSVAELDKKGGIKKVIARLKEFEDYRENMSAAVLKYRHQIKTLIETESSLKDLKDKHLLLSEAYVALQEDAVALRHRLTEAELVLAQSGAMVGAFSNGRDHVFTFPHFLSIGTRNDPDAQVRTRTLLLITSDGIGGLMYLDSNGDLSMMFEPESVGMEKSTQLISKAWLRKIQEQDGVVTKDELDFWSFLSKEKPSNSTLLTYKEFMQLPRKAAVTRQEADLANELAKSLQGAKRSA